MLHNKAKESIVTRGARMSTAQFVVYDLETSGLSFWQDRCFQFAGETVDENFQPVGEPLELYCRPPSDRFPSPRACLAHGIRPQYAQANGVNEFTFANTVRQYISQDNCCVVGYNNNRFDDKFLQHTFYRNFLEPYEWGYKDGRSRWDLIDVARACRVFYPERLSWPEDGSFKLEDLTAVNGLIEGTAHNAKFDVRHTVKLAELLKTECQKVFDYLFHYRSKVALRERFLNPPSKLLYISPFFGRLQTNCSLIFPLDWHPKQPDCVVAIDLSKDLTSLMYSTPEELLEQRYTKGSKSPIIEIRLNTCPAVFGDNLNEKWAADLGFSYQNCIQNVALLEKNRTQLQSKIAAFCALQKTFPVNPDVEGQLYSNFFSNRDKRKISEIQNLDPSLLGTVDTAQLDPRIEKLLFRFRGRNYPESLNKEEKIEWEEYRYSRLQDNWPEFLENFTSCQEETELSPQQESILEDLMSFCQSLMPS
jgi:exodeoxyribonuclease I